MLTEKNRVFVFVGEALICALSLFASGCNMLGGLSKIPSGPTPMNLSGNWQFDFLDTSGNVTTIGTGFLSQSGSNITGMLDVGACGSSAAVTGTVGGNTGPDAVSLSVAVNGPRIGW